MLLLVVLGLPLLLEPDSPVPDLIGFFILAAMIGVCSWGMGAWWILVPVAALVALAV